MCYIIVYKYIFKLYRNVSVLCTLQGIVLSASWLPILLCICEVCSSVPKIYFNLYLVVSINTKFWTVTSALFLFCSSSGFLDCTISNKSVASKENGFWFHASNLIAIMKMPKLLMEHCYSYWCVCVFGNVDANGPVQSPVNTNEWIHNCTEMILMGETKKPGEKPVLVSLRQPQIPQIVLGVNPGLCREKLATNCLSYDMAC